MLSSEPQKLPADPGPTGLAEENARLRAEVERLQEQLREVARAREAALAQAEDALRVRESFLSLAAHEIRTPVTTVRGYAQVLLRHLQRSETVDPERARRGLLLIDHQTDRLSRLVAQLLDTFRSDAGELSVARRMLDLAPVVARVCERTNQMLEVTSAATAVSHRVRATLPEEPLVARVDPDRFEQVLVNLLDNAIRFSPDGGEIEVQLARSAPGQIELVVRDYGIGIPPAAREQIFDRFYRVPGAPSASGIGMGLFVTRRILELHGGSIRVEAPREGGSRFVVTLPEG